jgi:hypothetical protein
MNAESFAEYLKNPSRLYQINYQELKSLALQYPYCQNLQWLLLYKSGIDHHRDFDANLEKTAAGSLDRTLLFRQMQRVIEQEKPVELPNFEETLDLREVPNLQFQPKPVQRDEPKEAPPVAKGQPLSPPPKQEPIVKKNINLPEEELKSEPPPRQVEPPPKTKKIAPDSKPSIVPPPPEEPPSKTPEKPSVEKQTDTTPAPKPKKAFDSWSTYQPPTIKVKPAKRTEKAKTPLKNTEETAAKIAQKSLLEQDEVISETLAAILARQGQTEKAIKMYERLILHFPKKSAFFAAQIKKLKST